MVPGSYFIQKIIRKNEVKIMLETRRTISLNGTSQITVSEGNKVTAVTMAANVAETGNSNIVTNIINKEVYEANKEECRADIDAFTAQVRAIEDEEE